MVSLEGNVKIISPDSTSIESSQVYWDPDLEWLFTEKNIVFSGNDYKIRANKMDADRSFKLLKTGQLNGNFLFEDKKFASLFKSITVENKKQNKPAIATVVNLGVCFLHLRLTEKIEKPSADTNPNIRPIKEFSSVLP